MRSSTKQTRKWGIGGLWLRVLLVVSVLAYAVGAHAAANFPFPQNYKYPYGITASNSDPAKIQAIYEAWKIKYYEENATKTQARIKFLQPGEDGSATVSEGIAYGVLIMVYMDNATNNTQQFFDRLMAYYDATLDANGLMNWKMNAFTGKVIDANAAPDADIDVAQALLLAYKQWNDPKYLTRANTLMDKIWLYETQAYSAFGGKRLVKPGDMFKDVLNPSYFITNAFRLFAQAGHGQDWNTLANNHYDLMKVCQDKTTGLMPDWVMPSGALLKPGDNLGDACGGCVVDAKGVAPPKFESYFLYDAIRCPWRFAQDYAWYGNADAKLIVDKVAAWAQGAPLSGNPGSAKDGYKLDGSLATGLTKPLDTKGLYSNACFTGGIGIAGMVDAKYQSFLNTAFTQTAVPEGANSQYFTTTTQLLYLLCMTGNMPNYWDMDPTAQKAFNTASGGCSKIFVEFNKPMDAATVSAAGWSVTMDNSNTPISINVTAASLGADGKTIALSLAAPTEEPQIEVAYSGTTLKSKDGKLVKAFADTTVKDNLYCARPFIEQAGTNLFGTVINVQYSKEMDESSISADEFTVKVKGVATPVTLAAIDPDNMTVVQLTIAGGVISSKADAVTVTYDGTTLSSLDGGQPKTIADVAVKNNYFSESCITIEQVDQLSNQWKTYDPNTILVPAADPADAGNKVIKFTKGVGTASDNNAYGSFDATIASGSLNADLQDNYIIKFRVRAEEAGTVLTVRLQDGTLGADAHKTAAELTYTCADANTWYDASLNYYSQREKSTDFNAMLFAPNSGTAYTTASSLYIDDIRMCSSSPKPAPQNAYISYDGNQLRVKYNFEMAAPAAPDTNYTLTLNGTAVPIVSAAVDMADKTTLVFTVSTPFYASKDDVISLSYTGTGTKALLGVVVEAFTAFPVLNLVERAITNGWMDDFDNDKDFVTDNVSSNIVYEWEEKAASPGVLSVTELPSSADDIYKSFGPTVEDPVSKEVWDLTNDPKVYIRYKIAPGQPGGDEIYLRCDLKDLVNNRPTDAAPIQELIADGAYHDLVINFAGNFVNINGGANKGPVDATNIVACLLYVYQTSDWPQTNWEGKIDFDYIYVGNSVRITKISATEVEAGGTVDVTTNIAGRVYIVPNGTPRIPAAVMDSVKKGSGTFAATTINTAKTIDLSMLKTGYYLVYAYDPTSGRLSRAEGIDILDVTAPAWVSQPSGEYSAGDVVTPIVDEDAIFYLVPEGTAAVYGDILDAMVTSTWAPGKTAAIMVIPASAAMGSKYIVYAVDGSKNLNISLASSPAITVVDNKPPVITKNTTGAVVKDATGAKITATMNEAGTLYLLKASDIANVSDPASLATYAVQNKAFTPSTGGVFTIQSTTLATLDDGEYVWYAIDKAGNIAGPSESLTLTPSCVDVTSVSLSSSTLSIFTGDTVTIRASMVPVSVPASAISEQSWSFNKTGVVSDILYDLDSTTMTIVGTATTAQSVVLTYTLYDCMDPLPLTAIVTINVGPRVACPSAINIAAPEEAELKVGEKHTFVATQTGGSEPILWSSSAPSVASVDDAGVVTAKSVSATPVTITASVACSQTVTADATVTVVKTPVVTVAVTTAVDEVTVGGTLQATADVQPEGATNKTVTWSVDNESLATIDENGLISAVSAGEVVVTATADGISGTKTITVVPAGVSSITVSPNPVSMLVNSTKSVTQLLIATTVPAAAPVTWTSDNEAVATVSANGLVTSLKAGSANITCTSTQTPAKFVVIPVTVTDKLPVSVTISDKSKSLVVNANTLLSATVLADDAVNTTVTWTSLTPGVATVVGGTVTGVAVGTAKIVVSSVAVPTLSDTCTITVTPVLVTSIAVAPATKSLVVDETVELSATVSAATDRTYTWSSSDESVATVSAEGVVTAISVGEATISATANDAGKVSGSCVVTVTPIQVISIDANDMAFVVGDAAKAINPVVMPFKANPAVTYAVTSGTAVTVDADGLVTPVAAGEATITITSVATPSVSKLITVSVSSDIVDVTGVTLDKTTLDIATGANQKLVATVEPEKASVISTVWSSDNELVATVSNTGTVTALTPGTAVITVTVKSKNEEVSAACTVTVADVLVATVVLDKTSLNLELGGAATQLNATTTPDEATNKKVDWKSSDVSVVTVTSAGLVTIVGLGSAVITASSNDAGPAEATCSVAVAYSASTGIELSTKTVELKVDSSVQVSANVIPSTANPVVEWVSADPSVATVDNGIIKAVTIGSTIVAAKSGSITEEITVTVVKTPVIGIVVDPTSVKVNDQGSTAEVVATVNPSYATEKGVTWESANPAIATVVDGVITGVAEGTTTVKAISVDNNLIVATVDVTVEHITNVILDTMVTLNIRELSIERDTTSKITATVSPANATLKTIIWSSSNAAVATVSGGTITALANGTAYIIATSNSGEKDSCLVTVTDISVKEILFASSATTVASNGSKDLYALISFVPEKADNKTITWELNNTLATISEDGVITAGSTTGDITVTATTANGKVATIKVTVTGEIDVPVSSVVLDSTSLTFNLSNLKTEDSYSLKATVNPENATNKNLTWASSLPGKVDVDANGVVTVHNITAKTTATITATTANGKVATCAVTVNFVAQITSLTITSLPTSINQGKSYQLEAVIAPLVAGNGKTIEWSLVAATTTSTGATISDKGLVTAGSTDGVIYAVASVTDVDKAVFSDTVVITVETVVELQDITATLKGLTDVDMLVGENATIQVGFIPNNTAQTSITFSSTNPSVATVSPLGEVTIIGGGIAVINVVPVIASKAKQITINVAQPLTGIQLTIDKATFAIGDTATLVVDLVPANGTVVGPINYSFINTEGVVNIVEVSALEYLLIGLAEGTPSVSVSAVTTGDITVNSEIVNVTVTSTAVIPVESITITGSSSSLEIGATTNLYATVLPENATNNTVTWSSDKPAVASVDPSSGLVSALSEGTAVITATAGGKTKTYSITVTPPVIAVTGIEFVTQPMTIAQNQSVQLVARTLPEGSTGTITYKTVSNTAAFTTVSTTGLLSTGSNNGSTTVEATYSEGGKTFTATLKITVGIVVPVTGITATVESASQIEMAVNAIKQIDVVYTPDSTNQKGVSFTSSNTKVVTVSSTGVITAVGGGTASIDVVSTVNSNLKQTISVSVSQKVTSITLVSQKTSLMVGDSTLVTATVYPSTATNKAIVLAATPASAASIRIISATEFMVATKEVGSVSIVASSVDAPAVVSSPVVLSVSARPTIQEVNITTLAQSVKTNSSLAFAASIVPSNLNASIVWSIAEQGSTNASITSGGLFSAGTLAGDVVVRATVTYEGVTKTDDVTITVTAYQAITGIEATIDGKTSADIFVGVAKSIDVTYLPSNTTETGYAFTTSPSGIISVDASGNITVIKGSATPVLVTVASLKNASVKTTLTVNAKELVSSIYISSVGSKVSIGSTITVDVDVRNYSASNRPVVIVKGGDTLAASITYETETNNKYRYKVKGLAEGTLTLVAKATDGSNVTSEMLSIQVTKIAVTSIVLSSNVRELEVGSTEKLVATVYPSTATYPKVKWSSSNEAAASVDSTGKVTAKAPGDVVITAQSLDDESKKMTVTIVIVAKPVDLEELEDLYEESYDEWLSRKNDQNIDKFLRDNLYKEVMSSGLIVNSAEKDTLTQDEVDEAYANLERALSDFRNNTYTNDKKTVAAKLVLSPNPAVNRINVTGVDVISVTIFDASLKVVASSNESSLDVSKLPAAVYSVQVLTTTGVETIQLSKE